MKNDSTLECWNSRKLHLNRVQKRFGVLLLMVATLCIGCAGPALDRSDPLYWQRGLSFDASGFLTDLKANDGVVRQTSRGQTVTVLLNESAYLACNISQQDGERIQAQVRGSRGILLPMFTPSPGKGGSLAYDEKLSRALHLAATRSGLELLSMEYTNALGKYIDSSARDDGRGVLAGGGKSLVKQALMASVSRVILDDSYIVDPSHVNGTGSIHVLLEQRRTGSIDNLTVNDLHTFPSMLLSATEVFTHGVEGGRFTVGGTGVTRFSLSAFSPPFDRRSPMEKYQDYVRFIEVELPDSMRLCFQRLQLTSRMFSTPLGR